jgi:hypothetical protein
MFFPILFGLGAAGLLYAYSKKKEESGSPVGSGTVALPGQVWTIGIDTSREMTEDDWKTYLSLMGHAADVMGVTRSGNTYVITLRYKTKVNLPKVGETLSFAGEDITIRFAQRAPVG